jgi:hypothetical protein
MRLAEFLAIPCETLALAEGVADHGAYLGNVLGDQPSCLVVNPQIIRTWVGSDRIPDGLVSAVVSRFRHVLVHGLSGEAADTNIVAALSSGRLSSVHPIDAGNHEYQIAEGSRDICGPFSGLSFGPANPANDHVFSVTDGGEAVRQLISIAGSPFMAVVRREGSEIVFLASADVADLETEVGRAPLAGYFSQLVPQAMALRHIGGDACWRPREHHASLIIDDPLLRRKYGFLNFDFLLELTKRHNFHTTIAFIPHNFRRSSPKITKMFRENASRLAICFHGNDHIGAEFGSEDLPVLGAMLDVAERRMNLHTKLTGLECDKVMVFPQGNFSVEAMSALQSHNFHAAVNTVHFPMGKPVRLTIRELAQPAVLRYGNFPLFLRSPIQESGRHDIAFNLFFGRPVLIVEHHEVFQRPESLAEIATLINAVEPRIQWSNIGTVVANSVLRRQAPDGGHHIRSYAAIVRVTNNLPASEKVCVEWVQARRNKLVDHVLQEGTPRHDFEIDDTGIRLSVEIRAGQSQTLSLVHHGTQSRLRSLGFRRGVQAFMRRRLSEVRDNYLCKSPRVLAAARSFAHWIVTSSSMECW